MHRSTRNHGNLHSHERLFLCFNGTLTREFEVRIAQIVVHSSKLLLETL